ncbi:MAG: hypothetical protein Q8P61_01535 [Candidatus Nanopelagicales bacterium]|nr:hypothetical protein [Candidatus Nanopelagicales bacterium]
MAVDIEVRLDEGHRLVGGLRDELAVASGAVDQLERFLKDGDRILRQVDAGLVAAERAVEQGKRAFPFVLVGAGIASVAVAIVIVRRRRRHRELDRQAVATAAPDE